MTSAEEVEAAGIRIGTPVVYAPQVTELANERNHRDPALTTAPAVQSCWKWRDFWLRATAGPPVHLAFYGSGRIQPARRTAIGPDLAA